MSLSQQPRHNALLNEIASFLYLHTGAKYVVIGRLSDSKTHMHTLVFMMDGQLLENMTYPLSGTPCQEAVTQKFCYYPFDVAKRFPEDQELQILGIESYLGTILLSEEQEQIGVTALMHEKQIKNPAFAEHLIMVLSTAIEEEIVTLRL